MLKCNLNAGNGTNLHTILSKPRSQLLDIMKSIRFFSFPVAIFFIKSKCLSNIKIHCKLKHK